MGRIWLSIHVPPSTVYLYCCLCVGLCVVRSPAQRVRLVHSRVRSHVGCFSLLVVRMCPCLPRRPPPPLPLSPSSLAPALPPPPAPRPPPGRQAGRPSSIVSASSSSPPPPP